MTKAKTAVKPVKAAKAVVGIKLLDTALAINTAINSIGKRGKALDKDMHIVAVSCLIHADKHGDITLANRLLEVLPKTARSNALRDWFLAFGKFSYDATSKAFVYNKAAVTQTQTAINTPFWEFKPEAAYVPFDAIRFIEQAVKRVTKAVNDGEKVPEALVTGLQDLQAVMLKPDALAA